MTHSRTGSHVHMTHMSSILPMSPTSSHASLTSPTSSSSAAAAAASGGGTPIRFHFANGDKIVMPCEASLTFAMVKEKIWTKKKIVDKDKRSFIFRTVDGEVFFRDQEHVSRFLHVAAVFKEDEKKKDILDMMLLPEADIGDKENRKASKPLGGKPPILAGYLWKQGGKNAIGWKKRYFVFHDLTLYYFDDLPTFQAGQPAIAFIPMGGCDAVSRPDLKYKDWPYCFELKSGGLAKRDFVLCAEEQADYDRWLSVIHGFNFRRVKSITVAVCEELMARGLGTQEGLFRVSGNKDTVNKIKSDYNTADYPNLAECKDDHALSGVMKLAIREMHEPLLTYDLYTDFVALSRLPSEVRLSRTKEIINRLPYSNVAFLRYLCKFIKQVASHQSTNMMTTKNLSIVFAPNILRPLTDSVATSMTDNAQILASVQYLFDECDSLWPDPVAAPKPPGATPATPATPLSPSPSASSPSSSMVAASPKAEVAKRVGSVPLFGIGGPGSVQLRSTSSATSGAGGAPSSSPSAASPAASFGSPRVGAPSSPSAGGTSAPTNGVRLPAAAASSSVASSPAASSSSSSAAVVSSVTLSSLPLVILPLRTLDSVALRADVLTIRKQFDDYWLQMEMDITRHRMAVLQSFSELNEEIDRGVINATPINSIKECVSTCITDAAQWRDRGMVYITDVQHRVSDATTSIGDARTRATADAKQAAEDKRKKEFDEIRRKEVAAAAVISAAANARIEEKKKADAAASIAAAAAAKRVAVVPPSSPATTTTTTTSNRVALPSGSPPPLPRGAPPPLPSNAPPPLPSSQPPRSLSSSAAAAAAVSPATTPAVSPSVVQAVALPIVDDDPPPPPPDEDELDDNNRPLLCNALALYGYEGGTRDGDIKLVTGDRIAVIQYADEQGWWRGRVLPNGIWGYFPAGYAKPE